MHVLVTGANGFIGSRLVECLSKTNHSISVVTRKKLEHSVNKTIKVHNIESLSLGQDWSSALYGVDVVIHLAARAHIMNDQTSDPLAEYRLINVGCTLNLARQAAAVGIKRFIYFSSIKVNGESTPLGQPFTAEDTPKPQDPYGISKYEAEQGLKVMSLETGMEVVIIRPPLVYGPGVKANFLNMMRWLSHSIPLPFGAVDNLRSLVAIDNLVDLIMRCIDHPRAANQIFLVSDGEDLSTQSLLYRMGNALSKPAQLISVRVSWLYFFARLLGYDAIVNRLCSSLQVDISKTCTLLEWAPLIGVDEGLRRAAQDFKLK